MHEFSWLMMIALLPCAHACTRGKVISYVVIVIVFMDTKISKSGDLGKHNKFVKFGKKLASICLESSGTACKHHKQCILVGHHSRAHRPCPLCIMHALSAHAYD